MRNLAIFAVCASLFGAHFLSQDDTTEAQAATPTFFVEQSVAPVEMQLVSLQSDAVCVDGSCGAVSRSSSYAGTKVRRGLFGRRVVTSYGSSGRWLPGKNIARLFRRR